MTRPEQKRNNRLRNARREAGLTQGQLADRIGTSEKSVQRWEAGQAIPQPIALHALCEELGKTAEALGFGDLEEAQLEEEEQPALQRIEQEQCREKQRQSPSPLRVPYEKRSSPPPRQRNFHLMIWITTILVVAILVGRVAMAAFSHTPILRQSIANVSKSDCGQHFSGPFHGQVDAKWYWYSSGQGAILCLSPHGSLSITAPPNSDLNPEQDLSHNLQAPRLLQSITGDFTIQTHLQFHPTVNFQSAGLLLWQDPNTFLRFERFHGSKDEGILLQKYDNKIFSRNLATNYLTSTQSLDLQVQKQGDHVTASWREPGHAWQTVGTTDLHFDRLMVGLDVLAVYRASQTTATFTSFTVSRA